MSSKKTFNGSCHCKYARFTAALELADPPKASRCNCTVCQKTSWTALRIAPEDFKLVSPPSEKDLRDYQYNNTDIHRLSCPQCSVYLYGYGSYEFQGQKHSFFAVSLNAMDQPQDGLDLSKFTYQYWDGLHDNWQAGAADKPYPGGTI
jgi:hypothetical protein